MVLRESKTNEESKNIKPLGNRKSDDNLKMRKIEGEYSINNSLEGSR